ncbi:MAG: hypothetical protein WDW36_008772 [Sanguina aurantia]
MPSSSAQGAMTPPSFSSSTASASRRSALTRLSRSSAAWRKAPPAIAPLQAIGAATLPANLVGTLDAHGMLDAHWGGPLDLRLNATQATLNDTSLTLKSAGGSNIRWKRLQARIDHVDLLKQQAQLSSVALQGMSVEAQRLPNGTLDLAALGASAPTTASRQRGARVKPAETSSWHWKVAHFTLDDGAIVLTDRKGPGKSPTTRLSKMNLAVDSLSDDMHTPLKLDTRGVIGKNGSYKVSGSIRPQPLDAQLQVTTTRIDLAPLESYVDVPLNVAINSAQLSSDGPGYSGPGTSRSWEGPRHAARRGFGGMG